jgi:murein tripeptide amidase MpaA
MLLIGCLALGLAQASRVVQLKGLTRTQVDQIDPSVDVWALHQADSGLIDVDVLLDDESIKANAVKGNLSLAFFKVAVIHEDLEDAIRQEREMITQNSKSWTVTDDSFFETYRPYDEHLTFMKQLAESYPHVVEVLSPIGKTIEGREIHALKISAPSKKGAQKKNKPAVYLESTVHAREWVATSSLAYIMKSLAAGYGTDAELTQLLNEVDFYITPIVNIDGYVFTWETTRLWRKNRRPTGGNSFGVDINRNWGPDDTFCKFGSSANPSSDTYCGTGAFSEPETAAAKNIIDAHPEIKAAVDFHTYGSVLLWPWQYTLDTLPSGPLRYFENLGGEMVDAITAAAGNRWVSQQGAVLYPHSGGLVDYCYTESKGEISSFTFEGRGNSFIMSDADIIPAGKEQLAGTVAMANAVKGR